MLEVARRADILHGCTVVHEDYDERLRQWKEKYILEATEEEINPPQEQ
jgi:hypothetical protein